MIWETPKTRGGSEALVTGSSLISEHRDRVIHEQAEAAQRRQRDLLEQTSMKHPAQVRIRIWEQLHQMALPSDPAHQLLGVIAAQTDLSVEQVAREQQRRAAMSVVSS